MKNLTKVLSLFLVLTMLLCFPVAVSAAELEDATIDESKTGSLTIYKYDLTGAEKDSVWDSSYVSTGVYDEAGVNNVLGGSTSSTLGNGETGYGYAIKGVEFTYAKVADIFQYGETESTDGHVEILYAVDKAKGADFLKALGLAEGKNRYENADALDETKYFYQSDVLISALSSGLTANATTVKNTMERYAATNGTAMPLTDSYGKAKAENLPLGLYLVAETKVPEMVVSTTDPFLVSVPMTSVNGTNANENAHLLMDVLRRDWGFDGAVVTDWGGSNDHALGVKNGSTLEMPAPGGDAIRELMKAVQTGKITEADVDARLEELLELVFTTKAAVDAAPGKFDADAHHALARRAAAQSIVLLKNENSLLPLAKGEKVAVIGDFAQTPRYQGAGSSAVNSIKVDSFLDCLAESGLNSVGYAKGFDRQGKPDEALKAEAVLLAKNANVVLLCMGLDEIKESEGIDRADMKLAENQLELLAAVAAANPNVVVLLSAGSSLESDWVKDCKALVYGCLGGQAGAGALVEVLTGAQNPCGKLAETWARSYADTPAKAHFGGDGPTVEYREGLYVGYRYYDTAGVPTAFPFGYGLSYTSFAYSDLKADETGVTLTVTNTGSCAGAEVVQLYVRDKVSSVITYDSQLRGFERVSLKPGETRQVTFSLKPEDLQILDRNMNWTVEPGEFEVMIGASSQDIRLKKTITALP